MWPHPGVRDRKVPDQKRQQSASRRSSGDSERTQTGGKGGGTGQVAERHRQWRSGKDQARRWLPEKVQSKGQVNTVSVHRTHGARAGASQLRGPFALLSLLGQGEVAEEGPGPEAEGHLVGRGKVEEKGSRL